jgi:hypothetical protein
MLGAGSAQTNNAQTNQNADDTDSIQAAINALPPYGVLDGGNKSATVRALYLKPRMTLQNFAFTTKASAVPYVAPVTMDGTKAPIEDVTLRNLHITGNRAAQTNLLGHEDGARDGIRIVGRARNIWIVNCSAERCGTDGLKIFSGDVLSGDDSQLNFENIFVIGCRFNWNRRQGISADSLRNASIIDTELSHNGIDVDGGKTEGNRGARDRNTVYGAGADIEGYGVGCGINGLFFIRCVALGNARHGIQFWDPAVPGSPRFRSRRNIRIEGCHLDGGVSPYHDRAALEFSLPPQNRSAQPMYENVVLQDLTVDGTIVLTCVRQAQISASTIHSPKPDFWGTAESCSQLSINAVSAGGKRFIQR